MENRAVYLGPIFEDKFGFAVPLIWVNYNKPNIPCAEAGLFGLVGYYRKYHIKGKAFYLWEL